jgi:hypothetical protein
VEVQKGRNRRNFHGGITSALLELAQAGFVCWSAEISMPWLPRKARASGATWKAWSGVHLVDSSRMRDPS